MKVLGLHHISIVSANAQRTVDFYTQVLGLRLVKQTVNFDDPGSYHLYFGDETGKPGTAITFFEWKGAQRGKPGVGGTHHFALQVNDYDSLLKWKRRLVDLKIKVDGPLDRHYFKSIYFRDPDAVVAIFPSDHFIGEEERFLYYVERAISFILKHPDYVVLLGIKPTNANPEYGWIEPSKNFLLHERNRFYKVVNFQEKPNLEEAQKLFDKGCLWNSLVLAARCETLVKMYRQQLKVIYDAFKKGKSVYGTDEEESFLVDAFENIPSRSFSKCVLEVIPESLFVLRVEGILWSDWGTKEQVLKDLDSLGVSH